MKRTRFSWRLLSTVIAFGGATISGSSETKKDEALELHPFVSTAYWQDFVVSQKLPMSDDGRYRLKKVRRNGEVELYRVGDSESTTVVVKPRPKRQKQSKSSPLIVVVEADVENQSAKISEMRMK